METISAYVIIGNNAVNPTRAAVCVGRGVAPSTFTPVGDSVYISQVVFTASVPKRVSLADLIEYNLAMCDLKPCRQRAQCVISGLPNDEIVREIVRTTLLGVSMRLKKGVLRSTVTEATVDDSEIARARQNAAPLSLDDQAVMLIGYDSLTAWRFNR